MHIKHIHGMIEKLSECAKCELDKGIECIDTKEMGEVVEIIKELCEAEYYAKISKAMDESEYGVDYDEHGRMYYRGQPGDSRGRYMSRRNYEEPPYYHMTPDMMKEHSPEYWRDMDRAEGRMYYSATGKHSDMSRMESGIRDRREGKSGQMRRSYMESKEMGKDKTEKMKELEKYTKELAEDVTEMISDASPEEKSLLKQKLQVLMQKF